MKVKTNFGSIGGRRVITFKVNNDGKVIPAKFRRGGWDDESMMLKVLDDMGELITAHESFRRWKIARKAWRTRRNSHQMLLPL